MALYDEFVNMPEWHEIEPFSGQGEIEICSGVPWDNSYSNVRLYGVYGDKTIPARQYADISSFRVLPKISTASPIRPGRNVIKVPYDVMSAKRCNYVIYRNRPIDETSSDTFWYAFITQVEYLSPNSCAIWLEDDIFQNNHPDMILPATLVEREIVPKAADIAGDYTMDEGLDTGEYINVPLSGDELTSTDGKYRFRTEYYSRIPMLKIGVEDTRRMNRGWGIALYATSDSTGQVKASLVNNLSQGLYSYAFKWDGVGAMYDLIQQYTANGNVAAIISAVLVPEDFLPKWSEITDQKVEHYYVHFKLNRPGNIEQYTPRNKKLLTYPYVCASVGNEIFRYELSTDVTTPGQLHFRYKISQTDNPVMRVEPYDYGLTQGDGFKLAERYNIEFANFPKIALANDTYHAWYAQNALPSAIQTAASVATAIGGIAAKNPTTIVTGVAGAVNALTSYENHNKMPTTPLTQTSGMAQLELDAVGLLVQKITIRREFAEAIDNFFDKFGYKIMKIKVPGINNRSKWDYVKTVDCVVKGKLDQQTQGKLKEILDKGVTLWHTTSGFGDYTQIND